MVSFQKKNQLFIECNRPADDRGSRCNRHDSLRKVQGRKTTDLRLISRPILCYSLRMDINERNDLRAAADLPLLNVPTEAARLAQARDQAGFEREFARRRPELCHEWKG